MRAAKLQRQHTLRLRELQEESKREDERIRMEAERNAQARAAEKDKSAAREEALKERLRELEARLVCDNFICTVTDQI